MTGGDQEGECKEGREEERGVSASPSGRKE